MNFLELDESDRVYDKWSVENIAARNEFLFNAYHYFSIEKIENFEQGEYFNDTEIVIAVKEKEE